MTNYANWYAYYRTRMQMMKTSASLAFQTIGQTTLQMLRMDAEAAHEAAIEIVHEVRRTPVEVR